MARPKDMFLKAKTCKHAVKFTGNQGLFVRTTCKCPNKLMLPVPDKRGIRVKVPYIMAKKCINCKGYIDARKVKEKGILAVLKEKGINYQKRIFVKEKRK